MYQSYLWLRPTGPIKIIASITGFETCRIPGSRWPPNIGVWMLFYFCRVDVTCRRARVSRSVRIVRDEAAGCGPEGQASDLFDRWGADLFWPFGLLHSSNPLTQAPLIDIQPLIHLHACIQSWINTMRLLTIQQWPAYVGTNRQTQTNTLDRE